MSTPKPASYRMPHTALPEEMLKRLTGFVPSDLPVISLYLDARANEHGKHDFGPFVRKELSSRARTYRAHSPQRNSFDEDFVRIERFLENEFRPSTQGLAIFACAGARDFFEAGQFEAPFERHQLFIYDRPHLYPLARLIAVMQSCWLIPIAPGLSSSQPASRLIARQLKTSRRSELKLADGRRVAISGIWKIITCIMLKKLLTCLNERSGTNQ